MLRKKILKIYPDEGLGLGLSSPLGLPRFNLPTPKIKKFYACKI